MPSEKSASLKRQQAVADTTGALAYSMVLWVVNGVSILKAGFWTGRDRMAGYRSSIVVNAVHVATLK